MSLSYEYGRDDYYCWTGSPVLRNKLNIKDEDLLNEAERKITGLKTAKLLEAPPGGELNFDYVKGVHEYLFSDIYDWAGEVRKTDISKGNIFCQHELIEVNIEALMGELKNENYLVGLDRYKIAERLAYYLGDLNTIHPFREGNGRVQRIFIRELASRAGYLVNFDGTTREEMIKASDAAFRHDYRLMEQIIMKSISERP